MSAPDHAAAIVKPPLGPERAREIAESLTQEERQALMWCIEVQDPAPPQHGHGQYSMPRENVTMHPAPLQTGQRLLILPASQLWGGVDFVNLVLARLI